MNFVSAADRRSTTFHSQILGKMTQGEKEIGLFPCSGGVFTLNLDQNTRNDWLTILTCKIEIQNKEKVVEIKILGFVWLGITRKWPEDLRGI